MKKNSLLIIISLLASCSGGNNPDLSVEPLKQYALSIPTCNHLDCINFTLPSLPKDVEKIIKQRKIDNDFILYNSLILARQYRSHIETAHQSYIIDKAHPAWKAFIKYSGIKFSTEYETSSIIYAWLYENRDNLDPLLKVEYAAIKQENERIDSGVYWQ